MNQPGSLIRNVAILWLAAWYATPALAQDVIMTIARDASVVNHYPGPDGLIGNADDVISDQPTSIQASAPNGAGSFGHNAFSFSGSNDPALPTGFEAITFVNGAITVDTAVMTGGGGPIIKAMSVSSGTEPFPGHGAYSSSITTINSGTYDPGTFAYTLNVDANYEILGSTGAEPGLALSGIAIYRTSAQFGTPTGNAYFDNVVVPAAQAAGANSVVFMTGSGTLPIYGYPITFSLVAFEGGGIVINAGMNDAWVSANAPFQGLFFTVYPDLSLFFLAWFTFDTEVVVNDTATFGSSSHRWATGAGIYSGNSVTVNVELTTGGVFNDDEPEATQTPNYGTITIVFISCNEAVLIYNFPGIGLSGQMTLTRVVTDNVALCEVLGSS